jgi:hypothetical protein
MQMFLLFLTLGMVTTVATLLARDVPATAAARLRDAASKAQR